MSKNLIALSLILFIFMGKGFLNAQNMMHFTSETHKYSVQIPEDWKRSDDVSEQVALVMLSKEGSSVSISFYALNNVSAEQFIERYEKSLPGNLEGLVVEEKGVIKSRDDDATYLTYAYSKDGETKREKVCFYSREGDIALVVVNNSEESFHKDASIFDKIFRSFTFETAQEKVEEVEGDE